AAAGQECMLYAADKQLFEVAVNIKWENPQDFSDLITRLGGMHFLTNSIGCIGGWLLIEAVQRSLVPYLLV
ncbi:MAG: hypothetical protein M3H12_06235, partial [Chromatiales bacterium]